MNDPLLTVREVAPMIRKTEKSLRSMISLGTAPKSAKVGGRRLFRRSDVEAFVAEAFEQTR